MEGETTENHAEDTWPEDAIFSRRGDIQENPVQQGETVENPQNETLTAGPPEETTGPSTNGNGDGEKPKFIKLSRGARNRLKALLAQGMPEEEAKIKCKIIPPPQVKQKKKVQEVKRIDKRQNDRRPGQGYVPSLFKNSFNNNQQHPVIRRNYNNNKNLNNSVVYSRSFAIPAYKSDPGQIRVGILPINYPTDLLTNDKMKEIENHILKKLVDQKYSLVKPGFVNVTHKIGYILLICKDRTTLIWLQKLYNWAGEGLQVVPLNEAAHHNVMEGLFPNSSEMSTSQIFDLIAGQNAGMNTDNWKVISETVAGTALHLIIAMDEMSLEILEREKFKLYYKFCVVKLDHCMGSERDLMMTYMRLNEMDKQLNSGAMPLFNRREQYLESNVNPVYSSDVFYNRY